MILRPLCLALLLVGCPSEDPEPDPTPEPTPVPTADDDDDDRRGAPPWIVAEITSQDPQALISRINAISGYMRIGLVDVQPPFKELTDIGFSGPVNPNIKLLDMDGEGTLDITADIDVPSLQGGDPIASIFISGTDAHLDREFTLTVMAVDFLGNPVAQASTDERVTFTRPEGEPFFIRIGPVDLSDPSQAPCQDGQDNDNDGYTDSADPDCDGGAALEVGTGTAVCNDGVDNDGDGRTDWEDDDCLDARSLSELPGCEDGVDNDGDGWIDAGDPDCATGGPESGRSGSGCNNGADDDEDGRTDALDAQCTSAGGSED
jgi:hypothetical protein